MATNEQPYAPQAAEIPPVPKEYARHLTQQELADLIGTTRETLALTIGDFRRQGILTTDHQRVVIKNAERLLEVAEGGDN